MTLLPYPQRDWQLCSQAAPDAWRKVLIWHRARKWCRLMAPIVGWWNSEEWRYSTGEYTSGIIYQPCIWRDLEEWPTGFGFPRFPTPPTT